MCVRIESNRDDGGGLTLILKQSCSFKASASIGMNSGSLSKYLPVGVVSRRTWITFRVKTPPA